MDYGINKRSGKAHLLRNPSAGDLKLSASQKKTHKRLLLELESFPEIELYLVRSVSMRSFNFSKNILLDLNPLHRGVKNGSKITL